MEYLQDPTNGSYMKYAIDAVKEQLHTEDAASACTCTVLNVCTGVFLHSFSQSFFDI